MKIQVLDHGYVEFVEAWGVGKEQFPAPSGHTTEYERGIVEPPANRRRAVSAAGRPAQWEIREYADAVERLVKHKFPQTWRLFRNEV